MGSTRSPEDRESYTMHASSKYGIDRVFEGSESYLFLTTVVVVVVESWRQRDLGLRQNEREKSHRHRQ